MQTKVAAGGLAGALTIVLVWFLGAVDVEAPPEVASAITTIIGTGTAYLKAE